MASLARSTGYYSVSDSQAAYPDNDPVQLDDLTATVYELMGINPQTEVRDKLNRPLPISA